MNYLANLLKITHKQMRNILEVASIKRMSRMSLMEIIKLDIELSEKGKVSLFNIFELVRHINLTKDVMINSADKAFAYIRDNLDIKSVNENMWVLSLDAKLGVIDHKLVGIGSTSEVAFSLHEVVRHIIATGADRLILVHNHPSGNLDPSETDLEMTKDIIEAVKIFRITMDDHIIVTPTGEAISMAEKGYM